VLRAICDTAPALSRSERHALLRTLADHEPARSAVTRPLWADAVSALTNGPDLLTFRLPNPDE
jgi:hypothetical protein